jgi:hypothetical protein
MGLLFYTLSNEAGALWNESPPQASVISTKQPDEELFIYSVFIIQGLERDTVLVHIYIIYLL